jgi:hypothetical protein
MTRSCNNAESLNFLLKHLDFSEIVPIFASSDHQFLTIRAESREEQDLFDTASEQDITDTTPFKNHSSRGGFYLS